MKFKRQIWTILPSWQGTLQGTVFGSLEKVFALFGIPVTEDKQSSVFRMEVDGCNFYVKRYHRALGIRSWVGRSRIRLEARNLLWFSRIGVPVVEVVAYGEDRCWGRTLRGGLVTVEQRATRDLDWVAQNRPELLKNNRWTEAVIQQLADIVGKLHERRFCHNDLHWRNILVSENCWPPQLYLIDCPVGQRWPRILLWRRMAKDLICLDKTAKLYLRRTQRLRFFKLYRGVEKLSPGDKQMVRWIVTYFKGMNRISWSPCKRFREQVFLPKMGNR